MTHFVVGNSESKIKLLSDIPETMAANTGPEDLICFVMLILNTLETKELVVFSISSTLFLAKYLIHFVHGGLSDT